MLQDVVSNVLKNFQHVPPRKILSIFLDHFRSFVSRFCSRTSIKFEFFYGLIPFLKIKIVLSRKNYENNIKKSHIIHNVHTLNFHMFISSCVVNIWKKCIEFPQLHCNINNIIKKIVKNEERWKFEHSRSL